MIDMGMLFVVLWEIASYSDPLYIFPRNMIFLEDELNGFRYILKLYSVTLWHLFNYKVYIHTYKHIHAYI